MSEKCKYCGEFLTLIDVLGRCSTSETDHTRSIFCVDRELKALRTDLATARRQYESLMSIVRSSVMDHGDCKSGKRYNGVPRACTACMAQRELKELVNQWKGPTVRLA